MSNNTIIKTEEEIEFQVKTGEMFLFEGQSSNTYNVTITFDGCNTLAKIEYDTEFSTLPVDSISGGTTLSFNDLRCYNRQLGAIKACLNAIDESVPFMVGEVSSVNLREFKRAITQGIKANITNTTYNLIRMFGMLDMESVFANGINSGVSYMANGQYQLETNVKLPNGMTLRVG